MKNGSRMRMKIDYPSIQCNLVLPTIDFQCMQDFHFDLLIGKPGYIICVFIYSLPCTSTVLSKGAKGSCLHEQSVQIAEESAIHQNTRTLVSIQSIFIPDECTTRINKYASIGSIFMVENCQQEIQTCTKTTKLCLMERCRDQEPAGD